MLWVQTSKAHLWWGILARFRLAECDLALLSASEIYGAAAGVCMWQTDGGIVIIFFPPLFLTRSLFWQLNDSKPPVHLPQQNMSLSSSINTHTWSSSRHSTLLLSIKQHLPSALPSVNSLNNPCHLLALQWLIQSRHTLCNLSVNLSTSPRSPFLTDPASVSSFLAHFKQTISDLQKTEQIWRRLSKTLPSCACLQ